LQKFPIIYTEVDKADGRNYAIIVDEAHSSQTGQSALKLKTALADTEEALREYAYIEGKAEDEIDASDVLVKELISHGKHKKEKQCTDYDSTDYSSFLSQFNRHSFSYSVLYKE
jgi:type I restriction enzyme R subunit